MRVVKIFNNNVLFIVINDRKEVILLGFGIGFNKCLGDKVNEDKIEKIYYV